jgi:hypothetical protein
MRRMKSKPARRAVATRWKALTPARRSRPPLRNEAAKPLADNPVLRSLLAQRETWKRIEEHGKAAAALRKQIDDFLKEHLGNHSLGVTADGTQVKRVVHQFPETTIVRKAFAQDYIVVTPPATPPKGPTRYVTLADVRRGAKALPAPGGDTSFLD